MNETRYFLRYLICELLPPNTFYTTCLHLRAKFSFHES